MKTKLLIIAFAIMVIALLLHQYIYYGILFAVEDLHHETWIIMFGFAALILYADKRGKV